MATVTAFDSFISYVDTGTGTPIVFLHGNPTSSHLWRNVLPKIGSGRLLAPDLIGMGESGKPAIDYRFADHARYLDAWFEALQLDQVILVGHDWGGALAFDWAARHPEKVRGIVFLETIIRPMEWSDFPEQARPLFESFRTPGIGESMILDNNQFLETSLPNGVRSGLSDEDKAIYFAPYPTRESRMPLLAWPRELPIAGKPADFVARVREYDRWLADSLEMPKLLLTFEGRGLMVGAAMAQWCRENIAALEISDCGEAGHHAPEDQPDAIAAAISTWADKHQLREK